MNRCAAFSNQTGRIFSHAADSVANRLAGVRRIRRFVLFALLITIAVYVIWGRIEVWRLSRAVAAIQARGEPVDYSYWYARQVTAEQREAAALYARAADSATEAESGQQYRASQLDVDKPGGPGLSLDDIAVSYRLDSPALQLLDRATPLDFTEFGEANRELYQNQIPLQVLGSQACLRADVLAARGDADGAVAALVPCVRLQRVLLHPIYRSQHAERVLGSFRILFRHTAPSDASLVSLEEAFAVWPDVDAVERGMMQDRVRFLSYVDAPGRSLGDVVLAVLTQPLRRSLVRRQLAAFDEALPLTRLPWHARREALAAKRRVPVRRGLLEAFMNPPGIFMSYASDSAARDLAARRTMIAALAVERYRRTHQGAVPTSLDALVPSFLPSVPEDPFSGGAGEPVRYHTEPDGYVIYSLDSYGRDDGGALYGHGAAIAKHVGPQSPRDLGIRVPLRTGRHLR